jgi:hypothetical protein
MKTVAFTSLLAAAFARSCRISTYQFTHGRLSGKNREWLHDNICPCPTHSGRVLARMSGFDGRGHHEQCEAMRRLADAWRSIPREQPLALVDLPVTAAPAVAYFRDELLACKDPVMGGQAGR